MIWRLELRRRRRRRQQDAHAEKAVVGEGVAAAGALGAEARLHHVRLAALRKGKRGVGGGGGVSERNATAQVTCACGHQVDGGVMGGVGYLQHLRGFGASELRVGGCGVEGGQLPVLEVTRACVGEERRKRLCGACMG